MGKYIMSDIVEINVNTGEIIERNYSPEEISKIQQIEEYIRQYVESNSLPITENNVKISAIEKLKSLGLTEEEARAIAGI